MSYIVKPLGTKLSLGILMTRSGSPLTGLSPTIEVRRNDNDLYLDFSAVATPYWISSGGQRERILPAKPWFSGFYEWEFDQALYDDSPREYTVIYRNPTPFLTLLHETVSFEITMATDLALIRKMMMNKQTVEALAPNHFIHTVFDDDEIAEIHKADLSMNTGGTLETRQPI